jgi:two-component system chemotaxis response regulator CheY
MKLSLLPMPDHLPSGSSKRLAKARIEMHILIVDDSKAMRMIVRRTLRLAGYHVEVKEACSGAEAFQAIQSAPVDLILCDWNMPEMNGLELLQKLQQSGKKVKFGFVTSESSEDMRNAAKDAGALFLITKPFTADGFRTVLQPIIGS